MTSNSKQLIALAREFAARNGGVDERSDGLILRGAFASAEEQADWLAFREAAPAPFGPVQVYDAEISGDLDQSESYAPERQVVITIVKSQQPGVAAFVFAAGFVAFLSEAVPVAKMVSAELESRAAFQARGLEVALWDVDQPIPDPAASTPISVRELVRDYVPAREIAEDISPWIVTTEPAVESPEFRGWRQLSARRLLGALVNSASTEGGYIWLQLAGPPRCRIRADSADVVDAWRNLTTCARWVFLSGPDVEVRHIIFAVELARAHRPDVGFSDALDHALESAKTTYNAHVQSASRETLKILADLRKTVVEDTQTISQRTQELTGGLWRDFTVSAAPFVLAIFAEDKKPISPGLAAGFYFAAALFIALSFCLQIRLHHTFLRNQQAARTRWLKTLYVSLTPTERKDIAETPVTNALKDYTDMRWLVGGIYSLLVCVLVVFGALELQKPASAARSQNLSATPSAVSSSEAKAAGALAVPAKTSPPAPVPRISAPAGRQP